MKRIFIIVIWLFAFQAQATEEERLKSLQQEISSLSVSLAKDQSKQQSVADKIKEIDTLIQSTSEKIHSIQEQAKQAQHEIQALNDEQAHAMTALNESKQKLGAQLRQAFLSHESSELKIILNQNNPHEMQRMLTYYRYFNQVRINEINQLNLAIRDIEARSKTIEEKMLSLKKIQEEQLTQQAMFQKEHEKRNVLLAALNKNIVQKGDRIKQLKQDAQGLNKIIARLESTHQASSARSAFNKQRGELKWPTQGTLLHAFNSPREGDALKWSGVFIKAEEGASVHAIHEGKVVFADYLRGYGNLVIVDHGDKFMSLYANNETLLKKLGDTVQVNDSISTVGKNGTMPISGLYFEIRRAGQPVDPSTWIQKHL